MPNILYERKKNIVDRVVRCYLTLNCNGGCEYCSAGINEISSERKQVWIPAQKWAKCINAKNRHTILAGGEPFLYPEFTKLYSMLNPTFKVEVYTKLQADISGFLALNNKRHASFLVSLHPSGFKKKEEWLEKVNALIEQGFATRFHIVKSDGWQDRKQFLVYNGFGQPRRITCCDDQRKGVKSQGVANNIVQCSSQIYLYGPDGWRYHCLKMMGLGDDERITIETTRDMDWTLRKCLYFGACTGCDNNIIGKVEQI